MQPTILFFTKAVGIQAKTKVISEICCTNLNSDYLQRDVYTLND